MSKFNVGDKVRYIGKDHNDMPEFYPTIGTIGKITGALNDDPDCYIQWPKNSTSGNDEHWCSKDDIELVENEDMTNEEIWEMLRPKMEKNKLHSYDVNIPSIMNIDGVLTWTNNPVYMAKDVHNAIAIAYRSGYERAMKGRSFKIGEKKKKGGHWEPIDPNNLPKEGTKVRYSRTICFEDEFYLIGWNVGDEGIVNYHGNYFGVKREGKNWDGVGMFGYYFDMWVEDDE